MKLRCAVIVLAFLGSFASDSWGQSKQPPQRTQSQATQQQPASEQRGTENSPVVVKVLPTQQNEEKAKADAKEHDEKQKLDRDTFRLSVATVVIIFLQLLIFAAQACFLWGTLKATANTANAANLNAQAVMDAEGAQIFPVIIESNLKESFSGDAVYTLPAQTPDVLFLPPKLSYCFKNYGKTPAKLQSIMHNIAFFQLDSKSRPAMHTVDELALEIIGAGETSSKIDCEMLDHFKASMVEAAVEYRAELMFYGEAVFTDFFDRQFRCIWESDCRSGEVKLIRHEQRLDPDKKK